MKNKKKISMVILSVLIIILTIIVVKEMIERNNNTSQQTNSNVFTDEEKKENADEIKHQLENKTNKEVISINKEKITEKEIAWVDYQINNKYVNKNEEKKDAKEEIIKEYVILQNAKEENIVLTDTEIKDVEERIINLIKKDDEETKEMLDAFNMNYDEFLEFYIDRTKKLELISKWKMHMTNRIINNEEIKVDNKLFNDKYNEFKTSTDDSKKMGLILELIDIYVDCLTEKVIIEYID